MSGSLMGGGIVLTIAAALWLLYLVPTWLRRREYLATERNAVRLQQTLRILAETAEAPAQIAAEASARGVAAQERALKTVRQQVDERNESRALAEAQREAEEQLAIERARFEEIARELAIAREEAAAAEAAAKAEAEELAVQAEEAVARVRARAIAMQAEQVRAAQVARSAQSAPQGAPTNVEEVGDPMVNTVELERAEKARKRSLRRARAATSLLLLAGLVTILVGVVVAIVAGSLLALVAGGVAVLVALGILTGLARAGRAVPVASTVAASTIAVAVPEFFDDADSEAIDEQYAEEVTWTPQPLPKPLHLSEGTRAANAMASIDAVKELQRAAARADLEARAAELADEEVATLKPRVDDGSIHAKPIDAKAIDVELIEAEPAATNPAPAPRATGTSRFASMGVLDEVKDSQLDVDAVLRRRRAS